MNGPSTSPSPSGQPEKPTTEAAQYNPLFERTRWTHEGTAIDRFFDHFVPMQYETGFAWRCRVIGKGEEERIIPFDNQPEKVQRIIAANAEVLLELFQETTPGDLDMMCKAGKHIADLGLFDPQQPVEADIPELRDQMSRRHHAKWLAQFNSDLAAGKRTDADHRGAKPFDELPPIELEVMKVQTWANWRILGGLTEEEYKLVRSFAEKQSD